MFSNTQESKMNNGFKRSLLVFNVLAIIIQIIQLALLINYFVTFLSYLNNQDSTKTFSPFASLIPIYILSPIITVCFILNIFAMIRAYKVHNNLKIAILFGLSLFIAIGILGLIATILLIKEENKKLANSNGYSENMDDIPELHDTTDNNNDSRKDA
ncbi:hypothetical protein DA803_03090 [[Mycoplasma] phocae]|uniref:Uncharacterized protein n=1 Tax=[Mycoplasma] phocae TaxID=142651 RepID=A0A2Z5IR26_9BACT|nr:hypothetical protein [[Mycoplasma] phocae]AXE61054.1 hypothetical protein DA803_03090 [[Mycoplasma] phocae]